MTPTGPTGPTEPAQPSTAPTASTASAPAPTGWYETSTSLPDGDTPAAIAGADGRLWAIGTAHPTTLYSTSDGVDWSVVDLVDHGLPKKAVATGSQGSCRPPFVVSEHDDGVTVVFLQPLRSNKAGLFDRIWLADVSGDTVTVTSAADNGLERMPPPRDGLQFRTFCITDMTSFDGGQVAVGDGQWWKPYDTGSADGFAAVEGAEGGWTVVSSTRSPFTSRNGVQPRFVVPVAGRLVAVGQSRGGYPLHTWTSADGKSWTGQRLTFPDAAGDADLRGAAAAPDGQGVVVVGTERGDAEPVAVAWSSSDGDTWTRAVLPGGATSAESVVATPDGYLAMGVDGSDAVTWTSEDGRTWAQGDAPPVGIDTPTMTAVGDGLVARTRDGFVVQGLDWPVAS